MAISEPTNTITPDDLYLAAKLRNWDRLDPETLDRLSMIYNNRYKLKKDLSTEQLQPGVILYGSWTAGGHCVLVTDTTISDIIYNDPLGCRTAKGYDYNLLGERVNASKKSITSFVGNQGEIWGHLPISN